MVTPVEVIGVVCDVNDYHKKLVVSVVDVALDCTFQSWYSRYKTMRPREGART